MGYHLYGGGEDAGSLFDLLWLATFWAAVLMFVAMQSVRQHGMPFTRRWQTSLAAEWRREEEAKQRAQAKWKAEREEWLRSPEVQRMVRELAARATRG